MNQFCFLLTWAFVFSSAALEWSGYRLERQADPAGINLKGPAKALIQFYSSTKQTDTLRAELRNEYLEVKVTAMQPQEEVKVRFYLFHNRELADRKMTLKLTASSPTAENCAILLEGQVDPRKSARGDVRTHFWKKRTVPLSIERTLLTLDAELPEGLIGLSARLDITRPGVYRIYDITLDETKPETSGLEPGRNYLANGGAERGWYGTAGWNFDYVKMHDSGKIELWRNKKYDRLIEAALDGREKFAGQYSFRIFAPKNSTGSFMFQPVPFEVGRSAYLSAWMKADRKCRVTYGLFLANGIAYEKYAEVGTEWKKYEFPIPEWGKAAPGAWFYGDPAHGYSSPVPYSMPNFMVPEGATVWLDNVFYSVGIDSGEFRQERAVTASAKLDRDSGLYRPGETIRSTLRVRNTAETPQTATIRRVMRNFLGEDLPGTVHSEKITLAPHESRELGAELRPAPELRGALNLVYDVEGETTGVYFGILDRPAAPAPQLGLNLWELNGDRAVEWLKEFRVGTVRTWGGFRDWRYHGLRYAEILHKAGIRNLYVVAPPASLRGMPLKADTLLPKDYAEWFRELAGHIDRHRGQIAIYEFLNEFNIWRGRSKNPDPAVYDEPTPDVYAKAVTAFRELLKQHDPKALVAGPATCGTDVPFTLNLLRLGAGKSLDLITEHSYRQQPECPDYEEDLKSLMEGAGAYGNFRFAQTEAGMIKLPQLPDNLIERYGRAKAAWDVRNMLIGWANGVDHYSHFMFSFATRGCDWGVTLLGNGDNGYVPRPSVALFAYRAAADLIGNGRCVERLRLGTNYRCYLFDRGNARVAALWKWNGAPDKMVPASSLRFAAVYDLMGTRLAPDRLVLREFPCYIVTQASVEELKRGILDSHREENSEPLAAELIPVGPEEFAVQLENRSSRFLDGFIQVGEEKRSFRNLPPEEKTRLAFRTAEPISLHEQEVIVEIVLPKEKWARKSALPLLGLFVPSAVSPITADGNLADWPDAALPIPLKLKGKDKGWGQDEEAVRAEARLAWDDDFLYLALTAHKPELFPAENAGALWRGDGIQVAFDTIRNASAEQRGYQDDDFEYDIALFGGKPTVYRARGSAATYDSLGKPTGITEEVRCGIRMLPDRVIYELAFPKSAVSPFRLEEGASMRFNVLLNIANSGGRAGYLQLTPGIGEFPKWPAKFIDLVLLPQQPK